MLTLRPATEPHMEIHKEPDGTWTVEAFDYDPVHGRHTSRLPLYVSFAAAVMAAEALRRVLT